ncbi:hypothetical protein BRO54_2442 [Geobacillus proteiniphilus]|uniref:Uncharacterized protein n=1 Tax=Geobacillus proteiniphilus TaxID=860353 RepID=A0A1Q5SWV6_9BACL|nr:hypothetical protein BRO54_2442 [Geobacillus proteiniphilus]
MPIGHFRFLPFPSLFAGHTLTFAVFSANGMIHSPHPSVYSFFF